MPNKIILITKLEHLTTAHYWVDLSLPSIYEQHISGKLDVTTLQKIIPHRLDKPILTSALRMYTTQLKQSTSLITAVPTKQNLLNNPPCSHIVKPADLTFAEATAQKPTQHHKPMAPTTTMTETVQAPQITEPFDYQAELQKIAHEVETTLQAKFETVFKKMQQSLDNIETKVEQKITSHMDQLKATQADHATQENHLKQLETLTKMLKILLHQMNTLLDQPNNPTPMDGIGDA